MLSDFYHWFLDMAWSKTEKKVVWWGLCVPHTMCVPHNVCSTMCAPHAASSLCGELVGWPVDCLLENCPLAQPSSCPGSGPPSTGLRPPAGRGVYSFLEGKRRPMTIPAASSMQSHPFCPPRIRAIVRPAAARVREASQTFAGHDTGSLGYYGRVPRPSRRLSSLPLKQSFTV